MVSDKPPSDLTALAAEALDLWQEHLAALAFDPKAKAELAKLLEPSRRAFADWAAMMQNGLYVPGAFPFPSPAGAPAAGPQSDDGALRLAQLAHRVAELEKRVGKLESGGGGKAAKTPRASARTKPRV